MLLPKLLALLSCLTTTPATQASKMAQPSQGCPKRCVIWKRTRSKLEVVDLGLIFGGEAMTLGRVSRMEVRDGTMGLPVMVVSQ